MKRLINLVLAGLITGSFSFVGCNNDTGMSKTEVKGLGDKADQSVDYCEEFGWYGDNECDQDLIDDGLCLGPDPDCEETENWCGGFMGKACADGQWCRYPEIHPADGTGTCMEINACVTTEDCETQDSYGLISLPTDMPVKWTCSDEGQCTIETALEKCGGGKTCEEGSWCRQYDPSVTDGEGTCYSVNSCFDETDCERQEDLGIISLPNVEAASWECQGPAWTPGRCVAKIENEEWYQCEQDSDCVSVQTSCCRCSMGGSELFVNKDYADQITTPAPDMCGRISSCKAVYLCQQPVCGENGMCTGANMN